MIRNKMGVLAVALIAGSLIVGCSKDKDKSSRAGTPPPPAPSEKPAPESAPAAPQMLVVEGEADDPNQYISIAAVCDANKDFCDTTGAMIIPNMGAGDAWREAVNNALEQSEESSELVNVASTDEDSSKSTVIITSDQVCEMGFCDSDGNLILKIENGQLASKELFQALLKAAEDKQ